MDDVARETKGAATARRGPFDAANRAVRRGDWQAGAQSYAQAVENGEPFPATARLLYWIAEWHLSKHERFDELTSGLIQDADGRVDLRRLIVSPLMQAGHLNRAAEVLELLVATYPESWDDRRTLASVLGRLKRWDEAIAHADRAAILQCDNPALHAARIQLRLQSGQGDAAAAVANETFDHALHASNHAHIWIIALLRAGEPTKAGKLAAALAKTGMANAQVASSVVEALVAARQIGGAIAAGRSALNAKHDSAALRLHLAKAYLQHTIRGDGTVAALEHLKSGLAFEPDDLRLNSLYGETLLRSGRFTDALPILAKSCNLAPDLEHIRAMYARALRHTGQYNDAADHLVHLVHRSPDSTRWHRLAAAALGQAGRDDDASALFEEYLTKRAQALPSSFEEALGNLKETAKTTFIPQARLDWAWSLKSDNVETNRCDWEKAARWGHLIDHLLLEWLECREDQIEDAMELLGDLDEADRFLAPFRSSNQGLIIATAHIGPMYAGLMALELLDIPSRWLSSAPSIAQTAYSGSLISTSDQTEVQVVKTSLRAIQEGLALCLAVDGAISPAAARVEFEGEEITYSSFAARAAFRFGVPSIFYAPRWENGLISYTLEEFPAPALGETVEQYSDRWQRTYLDMVRRYLSGSPENLRLSGGLWRHIRYRAAE